MIFIIIRYFCCHNLQGQHLINLIFRIYSSCLKFFLPFFWIYFHIKYLVWSFSFFLQISRTLTSCALFHFLFCFHYFLLMLIKTMLLIHEKFPLVPTVWILFRELMEFIAYFYLKMPVLKKMQ